MSQQGPITKKPAPAPGTPDPLAGFNLVAADDGSFLHVTCKACGARWMKPLPSMKDKTRDEQDAAMQEIEARIASDVRLHAQEHAAKAPPAPKRPS